MQISSSRLFYESHDQNCNFWTQAVTSNTARSPARSRSICPQSTSVIRLDDDASAARLACSGVLKSMIGQIIPVAYFWDRKGVQLRHSFATTFVPSCSLFMMRSFDRESYATIRRRTRLLTSSGVGCMAIADTNQHDYHTTLHAKHWWQSHHCSIRPRPNHRRCHPRADTRCSSLYFKLVSPMCIPRTQGSRCISYARY